MSRKNSKKSTEELKSYDKELQVVREELGKTFLDLQNNQHARQTIRKGLAGVAATLAEIDLALKQADHVEAVLLNRANNSKYLTSSPPAQKARKIVGIELQICNDKFPAEEVTVENFSIFPIKVGKKNTCDICLGYGQKNIFPEHFLIITGKNDTQLLLVDLNARPTCYINRDVNFNVTTPLREGDVIQIGNPYETGRGQIWRIKILSIKREGDLEIVPIALEDEAAKPPPSPQGLQRRADGSPLKVVRLAHADC